MDKNARVNNVRRNGSIHSAECKLIRRQKLQIRNYELRITNYELRIRVHKVHKVYKVRKVYKVYPVK